MFKYLNEVRIELRKVVWPKKGEVAKLTLIVIGITLVVSAYLGGLDLLFTKLLEFLVAKK